MKTLWNMLSFLAVVNLLALLLFGGWLWHSGRLDMTRVRAARDMFAITIEAEQDAQAEAEAQAQAEADEAAARAQRNHPDLSSEAQIQQASLTEGETAQAMRRLRDETEQLLAQLRARGAQLDQREAALEQAKAAWETSIAEEHSRRLDEQFQKTVRQYASAPPKIAKEWILELVELGEQAQVVSYLDAMEPRAASKILREFKTEQEAALATELLEHLRTFGLDAVASETSSHDERSTDPAQSGDLTPGS